MILRKKSRKPFKIFFALGLYIFLIILLGHNFYDRLKYQIYDKIESHESGFSSMSTFMGKNRKLGPVLINMSKNISESVFNSSFSINKKNKIPEVYLDIKFGNYKKILEDMETATQNDIGHEFTKVNGEITYKDRKVKCKVRLKGDLSDHWRSTLRMRKNAARREPRPPVSRGVPELR